MGGDLHLPPFPDSISSLAFHPTHPALLLSGSWDRNVYLHNLESPAKPTKLAMRGSVLDVSWVANSNSKAYVGGTDCQVRSVDFETGATSLIAEHTAPVKCVEYSASMASTDPLSDLVVSASWDKTIQFSSPHGGGRRVQYSVPVPDKVYSLSLTDTKVVAAMGGRAIWIWDTRMIKDTLAVDVGEKATEMPVFQKRESSLKFMTRAVKCMPNDEGYVTTSIEGRVAVEFFDAAPEVQAKKYAFKSHRQTVDGVDQVYPVSGLAFNPVHGTFATGGGDATVSLWDPFAKKRLKQFPKYPSPISALEFNADGTKLAVAFSQDDEGGNVSAAERGNGNGIIVRDVAEECRPKART